MKAKLESEDSYSNISNKGDVIKPLELIQSIAFDYKSKLYPHLAIYNLLMNFYIYHKKPSMTNNMYLAAHQDFRDVITHYTETEPYITCLLNTP